MIIKQLARPKSFLKVLGLASLSGLLVGGVISCASSQEQPQGSANSRPKWQDYRIGEEESLQAHSAKGESWMADSSSDYFDWPVDEARFVRGFIPNPPRRKRAHWGIDVAFPKGTPILASHDGIVIYAGSDFGGYGNMVMIEGNRGWATLYGHFAKIEVKEGERVRQGDRIGQMGTTGRSTGVHLHFEIRRLSGPVDPLKYLPGGRAIASTSKK
jgi:murein DD-endopeptidase MepM/ murein hydrolase activator NlpD